jgi:CHAT domain-containing protein
MRLIKPASQTFTDIASPSTSDTPWVVGHIVRSSNKSSGAEAVLGTLWLANPTAIGKLLTSMAEYHKSEGNTWVQALTKAQRDLIEGNTFKNPWFWAPYQLIGRWR